MISEEFFSGFCKAQNQTRTVLCEYETDREGHKAFTGSDCAYARCPHAAECLLMKEAVEFSALTCHPAGDGL